jgi:hypothetical protein
MNGSGIGALASRDVAGGGWIAPLGAALAYPFVLKLFHACVGGGAFDRVVAAVALTAAILLPFALCVARVIAENRKGPGRDTATVRIALLCACAAPLYTAMGVLLYMAGDPVSDLIAWLVVWPALAACTFAFTRAYACVPRAPRLRVAHGVAALAIALLFLAMHIGNHLAGLLGEDAHRHLMELFRHVYRAPVIEPLVVLLFLFQVASGALMVRRHTHGVQDALGVVQLVTGAYLVFFCLGHMNSVFFYARAFAGIPTDWAFATGAPTGLVHDAWNVRLVPHYLLGVFSVLAHLAVGLRGIATAHGLAQRTADRVCWVAIAASAVVACAILLGMTGMRLALH